MNHIFYLAILYIPLPLWAQSAEPLYSGLNQSTDTIHIDMIAPTLFITNLKTGRQLKLNEGQQIWIYCRRIKNNGYAIKAAKITYIDNHKIAFTPNNKHYEPDTLFDSSISYIAFTTSGSVARGIFVNTVLVATVVFVTLVVIVANIVAIVSGNSTIDGFGDGTLIASLPWDNCRRQIKVFDRNGQRKWELLAVGK